MGFFESNRERIRIAIVIVSIVFIIVAPFVSDSYKSIDPIVIVEESQMGGTIGYTVSKTSCTAQREIVVYNGTVSDPSADWWYYSQHCEVNNDEFGVNVELSGIVNVTRTYSQLSSVIFDGSPTLPLQNYSEVTFLVSISTIQGSVNASLYGYIMAWPEEDYCDPGDNTTHLEEGESTTLVVKISPTEVYNLTSGWIVRSKIQLHLTSSEESSIQIGEVLVTAYSNEDLYPVAFDMQSPDAESLLVNPYMSTLRELHSLGHYTVNGQFSCFPAIELSRISSATESSIFVPRTSNETLYLTAGQYEGIAGWFAQHDIPQGDFTEGWLDDSFNISFMLEPGDSILVQIRITTYRLTIDLSPSFAYSVVWVDAGTSSYVARYNGYFPLQETEYLFIPKSTVYSISLGAPFIHGTGIFIETNGTTCVHISIAYPHLTVLGIILDSGQILGLIGASLLLLLVVHGGMKRSFAGIRKDRNRRMNLLPVSLYFITMFLPWANYSFEETFAGPAMTINAIVIVPIFTTFLWSTASQVTPTPTSDLFPNVLPIVFLYWIPIIYVSYLIVTSKHTISWELSRSDMNSLLRFVILGGPFMLGCYYLWLCILGLCIADIGLVAVLLSLPSWYVIIRIEKQNIQIHPASDNS
ncbi:MAG: hypothetical protein ACFFCT_14885 [Candidatus Odinarchaeota archaeon]